MIYLKGRALCCRLLTCNGVESCSIVEAPGLVLECNGAESAGVCVFVSGCSFTSRRRVAAGQDGALQRGEGAPHPAAVTLTFLPSSSQV